MMREKSMRSALLFLIIGFALSSLTINIGFIGEIQGYLSVWCYLLGLYLLRKEDHYFRICFFIQIYLILTFLFSKVLLYSTPIEEVVTLTWINFAVKSIQDLLIIYACHQYFQAMNWPLTVLLKSLLIMMVIFFNGVESSFVVIIAFIAGAGVIVYQLINCLNEAENHKIQGSLQKIPIFKMLTIFFVSGLIIGVITLYVWPYTTYNYTGEVEPLQIDMPMRDSIVLSNGWQGNIYEYGETTDLYVIHYQGKLSQKCAFVDVTLPTDVFGRLEMNHIMFGNGKQKYDYKELNDNQENMMIFGYSQPRYRVYLNPDDSDFEITIQLTKQNNQENTLGELVFNLVYYPYGEIYSDGRGELQQIVFSVQDGKWLPETKV